MSVSRPVTRLNLKLLQTFLIVAEHKSFREAAERTHRSLSAVSAQIRQLEAQMGVALLHRTTRNVTLTPEGLELLHGTRRGLQEIALSLRKIDEAVDLRRGQVSLACSPSVAAARLPLILSVFEKDYPMVKVTLLETPSGLNDVLRAGEVDFGVGPVVAGEVDLQFDPILDDPLMALVPRRFLADGQACITLESLARLPMLLLSLATAMRQKLEEALRAHALKLETKYEASQVQTLVAMAEAGLGVAILPRSVIRTSRSRAVRALPIVDPVLVRQIALITMRGRTLSPAAARLAQLIREMIEDDRVPPAQPAPAKRVRARKPAVKPATRARRAQF